MSARLNMSCQAKKMPVGSLLDLTYGDHLADEQDESAEDNDDELLTLADAVQHVARSTRQSRANSSEALNELDPSTDPSADASVGPSDYPAPPTPVAPPTQPQAGPKVSFGDAGHLSLPSTSARFAPITRQTPHRTSQFAVSQQMHACPCCQCIIDANAGTSFGMDECAWTTAIAEAMLHLHSMCRNNMAATWECMAEPVVS